MTTLSEFTAMVSGEANQGTRLDSYIPNAIRRAAKLIERNYSFLYMERFLELDLDVSVANPRFVPFPGTATKKINFVRYEQSFPSTTTRKYKFLSPVDPINIGTIEEGESPSAYWITGDESGTRFLVLDQVGTENLTLEVHSVEYSTWPTADTATHWLLDNAEDAMLGKSMQLLAPYANEPDWMQFYNPMWEEGIRTLTMADEEARYAGTADGFKMVYK